MNSSKTVILFLNDHERLDAVSMSPEERDEIGADLVGRRWRCGIYDTEELQVAQTEEELTDLLQTTEPIMNAWGPSQEAVYESALLEAQEAGYQVVDIGDILPDEVGPNP